MSKENYRNPNEIPSPEFVLEIFAQLDPAEASVFTKEQRMRALENAVIRMQSEQPKAMGEEAMDLLYDRYKEELKKFAN